MRYSEFYTYIVNKLRKVHYLLMLFSYLRQLISSVSQLTRSLSDFAEMLNSSSYSNILARYQQDLLSFSGILDKIEATNGTIGIEMLSEIKAVEKLFYGDETDLMKVDTITEEQVEITKDVMSSINEACNKTETLLQEVLCSYPIMKYFLQLSYYFRNNCQKQLVQYQYHINQVL